VSRATLRRALERKDGSSTALVPLIWRHAFRLEQMPLDGLPVAVEDMARALRNVPSMYAVDAVTVGADGAHLATACWMAAQPSMSFDEALSAGGRRPLDPLPEPKSIPRACPIALLIEVGERLGSVLGEQAGLAFVLPDPEALASRLGVPDAVSWADRVLLEVVRSIGSIEPDLVLFSGKQARVPPRLANMCGFFQVEAVHLAESTAGARVLTGAELGADLAPLDELTWLLTTGTEVPETADPACVGPALLRLRHDLARRATG
jgi:hypothetical protein